MSLQVLSSTEQLAAADLLVVGAGIVGLAHALEAARRGMSVLVLERDRRALGASVRNFGHVIVSAMAPGRPFECALDARERWLWLGRTAGVPVSEAGTLLVARHADELAVLEEAAAAAPERGLRLLSRDEVGRLAALPLDAVVGGAVAELDLRVDPRSAVARLAAWLEERCDVRFVWDAAVLDVDLPVVTTSAGRIRAEQAIVCPGGDFTSLFRDAFADRPNLVLTKLQMLRAAAPPGRSYGPTLATGLSLLHYPGFSGQPSVERLRARIERERPELLAARVNLLVAQLPGSDLVIGDTHEYGLAVSPFRSERLDRLILSEAEALLGVALEVRERWYGVYPSAPGDPFMVVEPAPGVRLVEVVSGVGMTTALGLAGRVMDGLLAAPSIAPAAEL